MTEDECAELLSHQKLLSGSGNNYKILFHTIFMDLLTVSEGVSGVVDVG